MAEEQEFIKHSGLILEKICELFVGTNKTVRYKRVSVGRVSTVTAIFVKIVFSVSVPDLQ